jgi:hypothetical protein
VPDLVLRQPNLIAFRSTVNIVELIRSLANGDELTPRICNAGYVIFTRNDAGTVRGFALGERPMERLRSGDPELVRIVEEKAAA